MNPVKVYFGFYEKGQRIGFSYITENLVGQTMGGDFGIIRSPKGTVARTLKRLIAKKRKREITHIGIYTKNIEIKNYIGAIIDGSSNGRFAQTIKKRNIKLILQNDPRSDVFKIVQKNARYAIKQYMLKTL